MSGGRRGLWSAPNDRKLLVIGGAEGHSEEDDAILERFVALAGGADARVVVIATASQCPELREKEYTGVFERFGAEVTALRLEGREQSNSDEAVAIVEQATGVFFTGGDQLRITTVLGGSKVDSVLHHRLAQGLVLAGTSAGAAMMSSTMILGGKDAAVTTSSVRTGPGMEFLPGVLIDMHFAERGRLNRLLSAVAMFPHELGLGIDENTAILVQGDRFEVLGAGSVTVIDAGPATTIKTPEDSSRSIALCGVKLHVLPAGYIFDLTERQAYVSPPTAETTVTQEELEPAAEPDDAD